MFYHTKSYSPCGIQQAARCWLYEPICPCDYPRTSRQRTSPNIVARVGFVGYVEICHTAVMDKTPSRAGMAVSVASLALILVR